MDVSVYSYPHGDPLLIDRIVNEFLSQGKFDKLRKECLSDADTKPAYQNLQQRVESTVAQFLKKQIWRPDLNKNQLRDSLRKHILDSSFFDAGINRIVDQVVNPNVLATVFLPEVEEVVYNYLSIPKPPDKPQKRGLPLSDYEKLKPPGSENDNGVVQEEKKNIQDEKNKNDSMDRELANESESASNQKDSVEKNIFKENNAEITSDFIKAESRGEEKCKKSQLIKEEDKIKSEEKGSKAEESGSLEIQGGFRKIELPSDDSQESFGRMGVERLRITEREQPRSVDSDDSIPLEINEKSMTESRDSEDSIMNQMSPISQGRLTPDLLEVEKEDKKEKVEKEEKNPLTFVGRIPKLKREDSESSKPLKKEDGTKGEKLDVENVYSSDESDSGKSYGKSDSDDKKNSKSKKREERKSRKDDKGRRDDSDKRRKDDDSGKISRDKDRSSKRDGDGKSKERRKERSRDGNRETKKSSSSSCSSSSREKSSSHRRSHSHHRRHKDTKSKDGSHDKRRKEGEKKKSRSADDHGKERRKKDDRRSTDRDSRERDKSCGNRSQGESRRREREQKSEESRSQKMEKDEGEGEVEVEFMPDAEEVVIEMEGDWMQEGEEIVLVNEDWICSEGLVQEAEMDSPEEEMEVLEIGRDFDEESVLEFGELHRSGAVKKVDFPKLTDDFYVKFNSTGFKYFEDWEKSKLDCEEEFKEFVDEAENNLVLISDDGSDSESEFNFDEENRKTISNLLKGMGNFKKSLMFDPLTSEFYKWTNNKFYQKHRKKCDERWWRSAEKNESDESIKENIDRGKTNCDKSEYKNEKNGDCLAREKKALHLKVLNKYKRRALRQGKQKRKNRSRKPFHVGIKEKNENPNAAAINNYPNFQSDSNERLRMPEARTETEVSSEKRTVSGMQKKFNVDLVGGMAAAVKDSTGGTERRECEKAVKQVNFEFPAKNRLNDSGREEEEESTRISEGNRLEIPSKLMGMLPESPEEGQKKKKGFRERSGNRKNGKNCIGSGKEDNLKESDYFEGKCPDLSPSPDSDDFNAAKYGKSKRFMKSEADESSPKKQQKRNYCQKYDSQDLYKPRPVLNSNRTRARGMERENLALDSSQGKSHSERK